MKNTILTFLFLTILISFGCNSSKDSKASDKETSESYQKEDLDGSISLLDHLRKQSGVTIRGTGENAQVIIRGTSSMKGDNEAVFFVNGRFIDGGLRSAIQMVPVTEIKSIKVLKPGAQTAIYGIKGANGVIEIKLNN